jgi:hypothetical protein
MHTHPECSKNPTTMTSENPEPETARSPAVDEVLRKIGSNLLLFQHIEQLLKVMMNNSRLQGPASQLQATHARRAVAVQKQTLGQLAGKFAEDVLADAGEFREPNAVDEIWISFGFTISADSAFVEQHQVEMEAVVKGRNDLIHHFLPRWNPASEESTRAANDYLDTQRSKALPMRDRMLSFVRSMQDAVETHAALMASPEVERQLELACLQHSRLVLLLGELATRAARADGWMELGTAGQLIKRGEPRELDNLGQRFGHKTLKRVLLATELFDVAEEATLNGGTRTIYRINSRYQLSIAPALPTS